MTKIAWADRTWNPIVGCSPISSGCRNCYAARFAGRGLTETHRGLTRRGKWTGEIRTVPERLNDPRKWKKPQRIFVCSMSDLFHAEIPSTFRQSVFEVMDACPQHTFLVLTKRSEHLDMLPFWPNVWLGVTVESCMRRYRIDDLRRAVARVRFVSFEPLLSNVSVLGLDSIRWAIIGGESGPGARRCHAGHMRAAIAQCRAQGVAVFVKQLGSNPVGFGPIVHRSGADVAEWPEDLRIREFPCG